MSGWNPPPGQGGGPYGNPNPPGGYGGQPGYGPGPGAPSYGQPPPYGGGPQTPPPFGQQPPTQPGFGGPPYGPPPRRKSHAGIIIAGAVGAVVLLLIVVVAVVALAGGGTKHTIATPSSAGGLTRNTSAESESQLRSSINQQRLAIQRATGGRIQDVQTAVYGTGDERYLFLGGTGELGDPDEFVDGFRSAIQSSSSSLGNVTVNEVSPGGDGKAVCAEIRGSVGGTSFSTAVCAWATETSFGEIIPAPQGASAAGTRKTSSDVSEVMRRIRGDVES